MPNFGVLLRAPGSVNLSAVRQLFPSITLTSRRRSPRGDDNLDEAELYIDITEKQLDAIYKASVQATETSAEEIRQIEYELDDINYLIDTAKKARAGRSMLNQTLQNLGDDATTKNILKAARELAKKAKRTSARVVLADSSTSTTVGLSFSFDRQPNADDTRKINHFAHLLNLDSDDTAEESESIRGLRSRRSDLSTFSYRYWGPDAYKSEESSISSDRTNSQLSPLSRSSSGMLLGDRPTFHQCHFHISNIQSNDSSTVPNATANLGVIAASRDHFCTPIQQPAVHGSACPACSGFRGVGTVQTEGTSFQDTGFADMSSSSSAQNDIPVVPTMQSLSRTRPDEAEILHLTAGAEHIQSHSMLIHGPAMVFSPTMNLNSSGSTGATNTHLSGQSAHCSLSQTSPSRSPEGSRYQCSQCLEVSGNPTV